MTDVQLERPILSTKKSTMPRKIVDKKTFRNEKSKANKNEEDFIESYLQ